jgi:catechol 2,3-dioxygenase-like lactoylglutathione lyase family enzyme
MIRALDHITVAAHSQDTAVAGYELLLGHRADKGSIQLANMRLELQAAHASSPEGLSTLTFAAADIDKARQLLERRGLPATRRDGSHTLDIAPAATHGVAISLVARDAGAPVASPSPLLAAESDAAVSALDHVVVRSPDPERAIALYAGRLGLSLRLDRSEPAWGARLIFFRCGDLIVEVVHDLKAGVGAGPDRLWGLSWRVPEITKAHARMRAVGVDVSETRSGRRPNTQVFSVRSHTAGVPTLVLGLAAKEHIVVPSHPLVAP